MRLDVKKLSFNFASMAELHKRYRSFMISDILQESDKESTMSSSESDIDQNCDERSSKVLSTKPDDWRVDGYAVDAADKQAVAFSATLQTLFWQQLFLRRKMQLQAKPRKGGQIRFTNHQTIDLEKKFQKQKYLAPMDRKGLALELGLSERQVKTWFQNRRAKWRRLKHTMAVNFNRNYQQGPNGRCLDAIVDGETSSGPSEETTSY